MKRALQRVSSKLLLLISHHSRQSAKKYARFLGVSCGSLDRYNPWVLMKIFARPYAHTLLAGHATLRLEHSHSRVQKIEPLLFHPHPHRACASLTSSERWLARVQLRVDSPARAARAVT